MRRMARKLQKLATRLLELPQDVVFDLPRITMIGNMQLYIENHRGVREFSTERLTLSLSKGALEVVGSNLSIRAILQEEVFIEGVIQDIKYVPE